MIETDTDTIRNCNRKPMSFLKNPFAKSDEPINSYQDFWNWFAIHERKFFNSVKQSDAVEGKFFRPLSQKLEQLKEGFFYVTGMAEDDTAELIVTADGIIKNFVFVEELVTAAPKLKGWLFTALKPALDLTNTQINLAGYEFHESNLHFFANELLDYPDEVDLVVVYDDFKKEDEENITIGVQLFLDNYLGELNFATSIDNLAIGGKEGIDKEVISIGKLKEFLLWREKEFVEKYEGLRRHTEDDNYAALEAESENGEPLVAIVNSDLLKWEAKASHPWLLVVEFKYDGRDTNGMPDEATYQLFEEIENEIGAELKDSNGYLKVATETAQSTRKIYFACKDFRHPSKILHEVCMKHAGNAEMDYDIFKDKYWQSLERFVH